MKTNVQSIYKGALITLYQVSWVWYLTLIFGSSVYSIGIVSTALLIGFVSAGHAHRLLLKHFTTVNLSAYLQASSGIGAALLALVLAGYDAIYSLPIVAVLAIFTFILLHNILLSTSISSSGGQHSSKGLIQGAALGSLIAGFILIPLIGINAVYVASVLSLAGAFFHEKKRAKAKRGGFIFKPPHAADGFAVSLFFVFWIQNTGSVIGFSKAYSLLLYSVLFGWFLNRTSDTGLSGILSRAGLVHAGISGGLAYILLENISDIAGALSFPLFAVFLIVPFWIISSALFEREPFSFALGMAAGFLPGMFLAVNPGGITMLLAVILIGFARLLSEAKGKIWDRNRMVAIGLIFVLSGYLVSVPLQSSPKEDVSTLAESFSSLIPAVLMQDAPKDVSDRLTLIGKSYDVLILKGVEREKGFYRLAKSRLRDDGFLVQKINLLNTSEASFKNIIKSTQDVFPHTSMWLVDKNGLLISSEKPIKLDYVHIRNTLLSNNEAIEGMKSLFPATKFTNMTLADSFLLLYFMSDEELYDYAIEDSDRDAAFSSLFHFKQSRSNSTMAFTNPPVVKGITRQGKDFRVEFLGLGGSIPEDWTGFSRILGGYVLIEGTDYGVSFEKSAVFVKNTTAVSLHAFQSRIATELELKGGALGLLDDEVRRVGELEFLDRGYEIEEFTGQDADGYTKYVFFGSREGHEAKAAAMVWFCESNHAINVVAADYLEENPELEGILESIACF